MADQVGGRTRADWEAVERDYRTGQFTDRELGAKYGVSHTAVQKHARDGAWQKDLAGAVKVATAAKLAEQEVAKVASAAVARQVAAQVAKALPATTAVVGAMAEVNAAVIRQHRDELGVARKVTLVLLGELGAASFDTERLDALFAQASAELSGIELMAFNQQVRELMKLHNRVGSMHRLAETLAKLQASERKAFGLDEDESPDPGAGRQLSDLERAARIVGVLDKARRAKAAAEGAG